MSRESSFEITIAPNVLIWARESIGESIQGVAKRMNIHKNTLIKWESGDKKLMLWQLEKLAKIYKRPLAAFLLSVPPIEPSLPTDYRVLLNNIEPRKRPLDRY